MTYEYDLETNMLINENEKIQLIPISREEIKNLRISKSDFLIFKRRKRVFSFEGPNKDVYIQFKNFYHKCPHCQNFLICPKVMERVPDILTDENYLDSCRIEKYPFILLGYEKNLSFYVWKCEKYVPYSKKDTGTPKKDNIPKSKVKNESKSSLENENFNIDKAEPIMSRLITEEERLSLAFPDRVKKREKLLNLGKIIRDVSP